MCGILGSVNCEYSDDILKLIKHRGPDSKGSLKFNIIGKNIKLSQTRLAIVELSDAGDQPMLSASGEYCIIFNGEIYNHNELRAKLPEVNFKGHSDTETILYYIAKYGIESVNDLNGIFAIAFLDITKANLYLARDRFGVKPLYYYNRNDKLIFSSEIRPLSNLTSVSINDEALRTLLMLRYNPSPSTIFKDINKIRPGHYARCNLSAKNLELSIYPYIKSEYSLNKIKFSDAVHEYGNMLESAVKRQLMSDVEVGFLLSGGVDSALVSGLASKHLNYKPKAFTIGFNDNYTVSEIGQANETSKYFKLEHHYERINSEDFFDVFEKCSNIVEEPIATTSFIPMYYLAKLASEHVKVVLTGQGADEPLGGYGRYKGEAYHEVLPPIAFKITHYLTSKLKIKNDRFIRGSYALGLTDDVERFISVYSLFTTKEIIDLTGKDNVNSAEYINYYYDLLNCSTLPNSAERMMRIDSQMNLSDDLLLYTDKITMNFSLECRVPMLDLPLVTFLESLPQSYKVTLRKSKIIHKEFARKILPSHIINRPKKGFQSPTDIWFRQEFDRVQDLLLSNNNKALNFLNRSAIKKVLDDHNKGFNKEKQIFLLLSLAHWFNSKNNQN